MPDDVPTSPILDLGPALLAKKRSACEHDCADVDDSAASITCRECGAELDPWWFLRRLAHDEAESRTRIHHYAKLEREAFERYKANVESLNAKLTYQTDEINRLIETKNKLWNERDPATGKPLGSLSRRRRRVASGKTTPGS